MLEIDGVKAALSHGNRFDWETLDWLSDRYGDAIDLATQPRQTDNVRSAIQRRLSDLHINDALIMATLERQDGDPQFVGLIDAYRSVVEQVETLTT